MNASETKHTPPVGSEALLTLTDWIGRVDIPVKVVGHTAKRVRVELLRDAMLPSRKRGKTGDIVTVPAYALRAEGRTP